MDMNPNRGSVFFTQYPLMQKPPAEPLISGKLEELYHQIKILDQFSIPTIFRRQLREKPDDSLSIDTRIVPAHRLFQGLLMKMRIVWFRSD